MCLDIIFRIDFTQTLRETSEINLSKSYCSRLTFWMVVAKRRCPHVTQTYGAFTATVDKCVTLVRVKLCRCDHLRQLFHVCWLNIYNVWRETAQEISLTLTANWNSSVSAVWSESLWYDIKGYWSFCWWSPGSTGWSSGHQWTWRFHSRCSQRLSWCDTCVHWKTLF